MNPMEPLPMFIRALLRRVTMEAKMGEEADVPPNKSKSPSLYTPMNMPLAATSGMPCPIRL